MNRKKQINGFTLIEMLVVIVIIGIIAAITVGNLSSAKRTANEASALSSMRLLSQAETAHHIVNHQYVPFSELRVKGVLDERFEVNADGEAKLSGYLFKFIAVAPSDPPNYLIGARPASAAPLVATGSRRFGVSANGVIYSDAGDIDNHFQTVAELSSIGTPVGN